MNFFKVNVRDEDCFGRFIGMCVGISLGRAAKQQRIPAEPINDSAVLISFSLIILVV